MKKFLVLLLVFFTAVFNLFAEETGSIVNKFPENLINASGKKVSASSLKVRWLRSIFLLHGADRAGDLHRSW